MRAMEESMVYGVDFSVVQLRMKRGVSKNRGKFGAPISRRTRQLHRQQKREKQNVVEIIL